MSDTPTILDLDPRTLTVHPLNPRAELGDLKGLVASIREVGVLQPLLVIPDGNGGWHILAGQRRHAAAIQAEQATVPCLARPDLADADQQQLLAAVVENLHRQALRAGEEARAFKQLAAFGLTTASIAKSTGTKAARVKDALTVAASTTAATVADRYELTLDQAVTLAEFDGDHDAVKALTVTARRDPGQFDHVASRLRHDRQQQAAVHATVDALTEAGVAIVDDEPVYDSRDLTKAQRLTRLAHDGKDLTEAAHRACAGHAAWIDRWSPDKPVYLCTSPKRHGHTLRGTRGSSSTSELPDDAAAEERKAQRREVIENNAAWRAAEPVRRQYIRDLLARRTPPTKGTLRYLTGELLAHPGGFGAADDPFVAELTGATLDRTEHWTRTILAGQLEHSTEARLPMLLLAQHAADREHAMTVQTWRHRDDRAARWLAYLAATGYSPSPIEQQVIDHAAANDTAAADTAA